MSLAAVIKVKEEELRLVKDHEVAVAYDAFGNLIVEEHGGSSSVDLSASLDTMRTIGQVTLVHNHPLGWQYPPSDPRHFGNSFSPEDIATACHAELAEIRAVGPLFRFIMRPSATSDWDGQYWRDHLLPALANHEAAVKQITLESIRKQRISREVAEANFWHEVWLRVASDLSLEYERHEYE